MSENKEYYVLAYYHLELIDDPREEVRRHKEFFENRDVSGRIYISEEGINGQMSGRKDAAIAFMDWMHADERFKDLRFKIHYHHENAFPKMIVKYREQLVALDEKVDHKQGGGHVSPARWIEMLESDEKYLLLDVRNDYEWKVGRFKGAEKPDLSRFRDFPAYADSLKEKHGAKDTKVMMYCTGGIRCELYSALMKDRGFEDVYQLDGGVIGYGEKEGSKHWEGKLFVFDDRLTVPIAEGEDAPVVGECNHCGVESESYYNCAHMDCNELFLSCMECLKKFSGCCQESCMGSPRVRPISHQNPHKPFRRWYQYFDGNAKP